MTNRTIIAGLLAAALACKGDDGKKNAPPSGPPSASPPARSLAPEENAWTLLAEATAAPIDPGDTWSVTRDLRSGDEPEPTALAAARAALRSHARAMELVERGVARGKCQVPDVGSAEFGPAALSLLQLARVKVLRSVLAAREGDLEDAARDLAGVIDLADLLARCGGGLLVVAAAQSIEGDAVETTAWLAERSLAPGSRRRLLDALATDRGDPLAIALASEGRIMVRAADELAGGDRGGLVEVLVMTAQVIRLEGATLGFLEKAVSLEQSAEQAAAEVQKQLGELGRVDDAVRSQLAGLLSRHPRPLDAAATRALIAAGLERLTDAHRRGQPDEVTRREVVVILSGLAAELGPAARLLTAPESARNGIPPDIERAFLRTANPLGRMQAALALRSMSNMVGAHREQSARLAAERARVAALLAGQGGAAK